MSLTPMSNVNPLDLSYQQENAPSPLSYTITLLPEESPKEVYQENSQHFYEFKSPLGDQSNTLVDNVTQLARKNYYRDEKMFLCCEWEDCDHYSDCVVQFSNHVTSHVTQAEIRHLEEEDVFACLWAECGFESPSSEEMVRHINFHSFHTKIKCHGLNMIQKHDLAPCSLDPAQRNIVPDFSDPWTCQWEGCEQSEETWERPREFYHHVAEHAEETRGTSGRLECRWAGCLKTDGSVSKLKEHLRSHSQEKMIGCPNCGALFSNRVKFLDHVKRQHVSQEAYKCNNCGKKFSLERLLRDHMRSHINHYKCPHCDMTCPTPSSLKSHVRYKHLTEKPYKCEFCDYTGKTQHDVKGHLKVHYAEVELKCGEEGCEYKCRAQATLKKHFLRRHSNLAVNNYACHLCDKRYNRGAYLTKHLMNSHNFSWPSGHSRFRYIRDESTGVYRLQTIRFESVDLQEELQGGDSLRIAESEPGSARSVSPEPVSVSGLLYRTSSPLPEAAWGNHKTSSFRSSNDGDAGEADQTDHILSSLLSSHDEAYDKFEQFQRKIMCGLQPASCRLCLASDILPPYLDIMKDDTGQVEELSSLLSLDLASSPSHFPQHVCAICVGTFQSFLKLREAAKQNDKILQINQNRPNPSIEESQNFLVEEKMEDYEYRYSEENSDDPDSSPQIAVKEERHLVDSNTNTVEPLKQESQERNPVVLSILKPRKTKPKASPSPRVQCTVEGCDSTFGREADMKKHVKSVHIEKKVCPICGESFKKVKEHIKIRHSQARVLCEYCDKVYYTESGLQYHVNVVHLNAKKKICHICAGEFRDIKAHLAYQHGGGKEEKTVVCRVAGCGKMLRNSQVEKIHYNAAHLKLKEKCDICSGWFKNLNVHITQIHKNHNKFSCEKCGKAFNKKCDLKLHDERVHLQKRYICPQCGKVISKIREHLRTVHKMTEIKMENIKSEQLTESV